MDVILNAGDSVKIPENCTVVERGGMAFFEPIKLKFKAGDFLYSNWEDENIVIIYKSGDEYIYYFASNSKSLGLLIDEATWHENNKFRPATESEKQLLLDKLHENGKDWDAEKLKIVDLKYVPKVGDCLRLEDENMTVFIECSGLQFGKYPCGYKTIIDNDGIYENNLTNSGWTGKWKVTKITREEFQSEFNKLGYEYDFETHTAKKIEWKPKNGDKYWRLDNYCGVFEAIYAESHCNRMWNNGFVFRTCELAEAAWELLKNAKHS